jgi:hypothetical protein
MRQRIAELLSFTRATVDEAKISDVKVDPGGGANITARHYSAPGDDSHPLPGDSVVLVEAPGAGAQSAVGYLDPVNEGQAAAGEKRVYSRNADGEPVAEVWLKSDGEVLVRSIEGGSVVRIAPDGIVHLGDSDGAAEIPRDDHIQTELDRLWDVLTGWTVVPQDGGAALQAAAIAAAALRQPTASDKIRGT